MRSEDRATARKIQPKMQQELGERYTDSVLFDRSYGLVSAAPQVYVNVLISCAVERK